jgi:hypothetical protein
MVLMVSMAQKVHKVKKETRVIQDHKDLKDPQELTVLMVHKDRKVKKVTRVMWDRKGQPEPMV